MSLTLPLKFDTVLKNSPLKGELINILDGFAKWIVDNTLEFFPEYTDHGIDHIQNVLNEAEEIISKSSWELLTPEDIYVLTLAILLHDSAMHISKEGFWELITNDKYNGVLHGFKNEDEWEIRWNEFVKEVSKFDEKDWERFFPENIFVEMPKIGEKNLEDNQKIIIGDFIRRNHAIIAQVIATYGIPTKTGPYEIFSDKYVSLNQLAGFVARSHNYSLREMVDILGIDESRVYRKTHPAYLMGVLRIADYLQFTQERTPKILFKTKGICSPISIQEWKKHFSILDSNTYHPDKELLFVDANPDDAKTLTGVKNLLAGLQKELDDFWAVNGEVYSRFGNLAKLAITIRRIKSNIDNAELFVEQHYKRYYPEVLSIRSDNQRIFPLLVGPLYGEIPQIGLRELVQNAIDACNERYSQEKQRDITQEPIPYEVNVMLDFDNKRFIIEDNGIGMDIRVIKDYFLKIGASFRYSEQWKTIHIDNVEEKVFVPRTGRFGIGMLAGFLIGDEIKVLTRKVGEESSKACQFNYRVNSTDIEINFTEMDDFGTKIIISSTEEKLQELYDGFMIKDRGASMGYYRDQMGKRSFWYYLDSPKVNIKYKKAENEEALDNDYVIKKNTLFKKWEKIEKTSLDGFYWRKSSHNHIYSNGIIIKNLKAPKVEIDLGIYDITLDKFELALFDNNGKFPLTLTRDGLTDKYFFEHEKFSENVVYAYFNEIVKYVSDISWDRNSIISIVDKLRTNKRIGDVFPLLLNKESAKPFGEKESIANNEYVLMDFLFSNQKRGILYSEEAFATINNINYCCLSGMEKQARTIEEAIDVFIHGIKEYNYSANTFIGTELNLKTWIFVKKYDYNKLYDGYKRRIEKRVVNQEWLVLSKKADLSAIPEVGIKIAELNPNAFIFVIFQFQKSEETKLAKLWKEYDFPVNIELKK